MYLEQIYLRAFRNYLEQEVNFQEQKSIIVGNNAQGKSNLLEAVELLATLKSHRSTRDRELVLDGCNAGQVLGKVKRAYGSAELTLTLHQHGKRTLALNKEPLKRQIEFLGSLNAVQFSSLDLDLVRGAPETRRSWIDGLLVQLEPVYAHILQHYNQVLRQRNALLKAIRKQEQDLKLGLGSNQSLDTTQLLLWDEQLATAGSRVTRRRARVIQRMAPIAQKWHDRISGKTETLVITYAPNVVWTEDNPEHVQQAFLAKIEQRKTAEYHQGKTVVGTHRDEIEFAINETPARYYGSQGQQRTLVLALKLAELELIEEIIGEAPLLLLDDVLAELDPSRQGQLLETIGDRFQTLITTTHVSSFNDLWLKNAQILTVEQGKII